MPGAEWFPGARLNYAEHMLGRDEDLDTVAVLARSQTREPFELTFGELREQVARARAGLQRLGVGPGDRVVAYLPNIPETLVAFLATASLGAIWATCPPEFGARSVLDRLGQLEPKVLLAVAGYRYGDKLVDRREQVAAIRERAADRSSTSSTSRTRAAPTTRSRTRSSWDELLAEPGPLEFDPVPFAHPLYVLFSSGTTGLPKAIVHGHGGILARAPARTTASAGTSGPATGCQWFTTTAWMMWNALVSTLLLRASIVMIDGNPGYPDLSFQWRLAEETRPTFFGLSPAFMMACRKDGLEPGRRFDLSSIRTVVRGRLAAPARGLRVALRAARARRLPQRRQRRHRRLHRASCRATRCCRSTRARSPRRCLGVDAVAFDLDGKPVVGELGELVIRQPMPSMPVGFWNDPDGSRYRAAYFEHYPGRLAARRLDPVHRARELRDHRPLRRDAQPRRRAARDERVLRASSRRSTRCSTASSSTSRSTDELLLFVVLRDGVELDDELRARIADALRTSALAAARARRRSSPCPAIPRTLTGKKLELPVKRILTGAPRRRGREPRRARRSRRRSSRSSRTRADRADARLTLRRSWAATRWRRPAAPSRG